jgi:hypothetical protein
MNRKGWPKHIQAQIDAQAPRQSRPNKMGAIRASDGKRTYASKLERDRAVELQHLEAFGLIFDLRYQVKLQLGDLSYRADFAYVPNNIATIGNLRFVYEDAKGVMTPRFRMVLRLWVKYMRDPLYISQRCRDGKIRVVRILVDEMAKPTS